MSIHIRSLFETYNQLKYVLNKEQKRKSILLFILMVIGAMFEMLGISMILPFIQVILSPEAFMQNHFVQIFANFFHINSSFTMIIIIGVLLIVLYLVKNLYLLLQSYLIVKFQCTVQQQLSVYMLKSYMSRPYTYFLNVNSNEVMRSVSNDVTGVYGLLSNLFRLLVELLSTLAIGVFIFLTDVYLATCILVLGLGCLISVTFGFRKILSEKGLMRQKYSALRNQFGYQAINGVKEIYVANRRDFFVEKYDEAYKKELKTDISYNFATTCPERIIEAVCIGGLIGAVCIRISMGVDVNSFIPQLGAFALAAFRILPSVARITGNFNGIVFYRPMLQSTYNNKKQVEEYEEYLKQYALSNNEPQKSDLDYEYKFSKCIELSSIYWKYENTDKFVLNNLDLSIIKGKSIAFIGASGAGKTTLADVILGLLRPQKGTIKMDGIDIFTIPNSWSRVIGYVPQTVYLIDDTISNNVTFGVEPKDISEEKVWEALEKAQLKEFVEKLPSGINTIVGERGVRFSGGQRQRIAIARALYYNPDILILDEATSALDNETETAVMEAIDALQGYKTLIIVAHRLTTIQNCDEIYEILDGKALKKKKEDIFA